MEERYLLISTDSHVGPSVARQLREFCDQRHLEAFDEDVRAMQAHYSTAHAAELDSNDPLGGAIQGGTTVAAVKLAASNNTTAMKQRWTDAAAVKGLQDPHARLRDMDAEGVTVDIIFAGGQNDEMLPFDTSPDPELRAVGAEIFNRWMTAFCSADPLRLKGVAQISMHDIDAAVEAVRKAKDEGFCSINFPSPRRDLLPYTEAAYEPFWRVCAELDMPLNTHGGGGDRGYWSGKGARWCARAEGQFMGRRALWGLIFGGVFERHPGLKLVLTEQMASWVPHTMRQLDGIYDDNLRSFQGFGDDLPLRPSEYWARNVFVGNSFMSRPEALMRNEIGLSNIMYGTDYPHAESVFPLTRLAMRQAFHGLPSEEVAMIVGGNAARCFSFDVDALRPIADRIGPTVAEINVPPTEQELAEVPPFCHAFRKY